MAFMMADGDISSRFWLHKRRRRRRRQKKSHQKWERKQNG